MIWHIESSSGKSTTTNLNEHMRVWDWVWGTWHWMKSLSLALSPSLWVYSWIIHWQVWPKSLPSEEQLPPLKPAHKTAALSLISRCCHLRHSISGITHHSYRVSKIALQYHNASGRTIYAQPEANSNRSRQQSHCIYSEPPIVLLKFSIICTETQYFCHFLLSSIAPLATHPLSREDFSWCYTRNHRRSILVTTDDLYL